MKGERDHKLGEVIACIIMIIILVVKFQGGIQNKLINDNSL